MAVSPRRVIALCLGVLVRFSAVSAQNTLSPLFREVQVFSGTRELCVEWNLRIDFESQGRNAMGTWKIGGADSTGQVHTNRFDCAGRYQGYWVLGSWNNSRYDNYRVVVQGGDGRVTCYWWMSRAIWRGAYSGYVPGCTFTGQNAQYPRMTVTIFARQIPTNPPTRSPTRQPTTRPTHRPTGAPVTARPVTPVTASPVSMTPTAIAVAPTAIPSGIPTRIGAGGGGGSSPTVPTATPTALPSVSPTATAVSGGGGAGAGSRPSSRPAGSTMAPTPLLVSGGGGGMGTASGGTGSTAQPAPGGAQPSNPTVTLSPTAEPTLLVRATAEECSKEEAGDKVLFIIPWILIIVAFFLGIYIGRITKKEPEVEENEKGTDNVGRKDVISNPMYTPAAETSGNGYLTVSTGQS